MVKEHYPKYFHRCTCEPKCNFEGSLDLAQSFSKLNKVDRIDKLRTMFLCLTSTPGSKNDLFMCSDRNRKRLRNGDGGSVVSTKYCFTGNEICMNGFLAIVQVSRAILQMHAAEVGGSFTVSSVQTIVHLILVLCLYRKRLRLGSLKNSLIYMVYHAFPAGLN